MVSNSPILLITVFLFSSYLVALYSTSFVQYILTIHPLHTSKQSQPFLSASLNNADSNCLITEKPNLGTQNNWVSLIKLKRLNIKAHLLWFIFKTGA